MRHHYHWTALRADSPNDWHWHTENNTVDLNQDMTFWDTDLDEPSSNQGCVVTVVGRMDYRKKWRVYNCALQRPYICSYREENESNNNNIRQTILKSLFDKND